MTTMADDHGTRERYRSGCHCDECKAAAAAYRAQRRRSPRTYVPAGAVRKHLAELVACGLSLREIARLSGVDRETIRGLDGGKYPRCTVATKRALLGVLPPRPAGDISVVTDVEDAEPTYVDPLAALRLIVEGDEIAWKTDGECTPARLALAPELIQQWFFPERGQSPRHALEICARCPVWEPCLQHALDTNAEGIWGRSAGSHRRKLVHHGLTVADLAAVGMRDDPDLPIARAIQRALDARPDMEVA